MRAEIIRKKMQKTVLKQVVQIIRLPKVHLKQKIGIWLKRHDRLFSFYLQYNIRIITSRLRGLPDFSIIGAQKGGTTSLYYLITKHSDIAPARNKEIHYFAKNYRFGEQWYRSNFPTNLTKNRFYKKTGRKLLTVDATPGYIFHPMAPNRMKKILPNIKLIVILRNPIDRAYSHYHYNIRYGYDTLTSFENAIELSKKRCAREKEWIIRELDFDYNQYLKHAYLAKGIYADQLQNWFKYYNKKQFLFLTTEDFYKNTQHVLDQAFNFLGLNPSKIGNLKKYNVGNYKEKMNEDTRKSLIEYFKPHNERLYKLLQRDFDWDK